MIGCRSAPDGFLEALVDGQVAQGAGSYASDLRVAAPSSLNECLDSPCGANGLPVAVAAACEVPQRPRSKLPNRIPFLGPWLLLLLREPVVPMGLGVQDPDQRLHDPGIHDRLLHCRPAVVRQVAEGPCCGVATLQCAALEHLDLVAQHKGTSRSAKSTLPSPPS